ncbi:MAG: hypothetical protein M3Y85_07150 [Bacteroidota bacterium]|nr:hypothetical protein [Bacteroidota bacterium]
MKLLVLICMCVPLFSLTQDLIPKKVNTIEVSGVTFKEVANALLEDGFTFEKIDSNFLTIKTDFKEGAGKNKWMKLRLFTRVKDSTVFITGEWYNSLFIGGKILGVDQTIENSTYKIEYTS